MCRAPVVPVRPAKQGKQAVVSPPGLASRLHSQAGKLIGHAEEPEDQDLLVMSDIDSDGGPQEDPVLADDDLFLVGVHLDHHASGSCSGLEGLSILAHTS